MLIVVDKSCLIQLESDPLILGDHVDAFRDDAICHLESVFSSQHTEQKITESERSRLLVRPSRNMSCKIRPTSLPFSSSGTKYRRIGRWTLTRNSMDGSTAVFRLNAEPGQGCGCAWACTAGTASIRTRPAVLANLKVSPVTGATHRPRGKRPPSNYLCVMDSSLLRGDSLNLAAA